ncbi:DUF2182 domain-containing protein [Glaciimonas immobilis]|uniref:Putative metal-binding membrane protein n=1 Tax=Glaciimonas immobilis TaxID=728004 RepID=A0A840RZQ7_9BURK|nr:DUF2182 domain-containing protein [Glaciimonas immobilis]KAF3995893.1 DUF2182 domain-containing protein [Glaciimonas immobilis]MBB5202588.1 putative metal-binding membrane protein [Glaciimonas immobilis]
MIYSRNEFTRIRIYILVTSFVAWVTIVALPFWLGPELPVFMCGSRWTQGSTVNWMLSVSGGWMLMIVAMMAPISLPPLFHIRISSFSDRQWRSASLFLIGYLTIWFITCLAMKALEAVVNQDMQNGHFQAWVTVFIACLWQVSPLKQRCLNQCHNHRPLAAFGWRADIDVLRFGLEHGMWCLGSCWALMLFAESLSQWHIAGMVIVALIMFCERLDPPMRPDWRLRGFRTASLHLHHSLSVSRHA